MVDFEFKPCYNVEDLRALVKALRSEGGCPWDREQTHESIRRDFIEEVCEAVEAINEGNIEHLREELGDVLFQVAFHAELEEEKGNFDLDSVADGVVKKLILRHPHVFGEVTVSGSEELKTAVILPIKEVPEN
ncbi:MAG: nucleoside triphosphate pyrophosphohydrolase, partial [Oscillospiraceae bacterium]|nr:nucleoside triphosphate pyrophosphohydrolase [Oscillospiraceae bacterium]